jgi:spore coat polysaccharide biosynthesis predicted glycosyltransferase SpsG
VVAKRLKRICFYTSDYGYGHASRDIALIRKIQKAGFAEVFVKTDTAFDFMRQSLPGCNVIRQQNDIGPVYKDESIKVDRYLTERAL